MSFHPIDPKQMQDYEAKQKYFEKRIFIYSDRKPLQKQVSWAGKNFKLGDPIPFAAPGKISQPSKAILRLPITYEGETILKLQADGFLFVYSKSTSTPTTSSEMSGTGVSTSQIHFQVYPLTKV